MKYKIQIVTLRTDEGLCTDLRMLKEIWEMRCKEHFSHYHVVKVSMPKKEGK
jgi:hypothetical protein